MSPKVGKQAVIEPDYIRRARGEIIPANLVTIAPGDPERETTLLLKAHIGKSGRLADEKIIEFIGKLRNSDEANKLDEMELFMMFRDELWEVAAYALDYPTMDEPSPEVLQEKFTFFEVARAFQQSMGFRTNGFADQATEEALKKYKAAQKAAMEPEVHSNGTAQID